MSPGFAQNFSYLAYFLNAYGAARLAARSSSEARLSSEVRLVARSSSEARLSSEVRLVARLSAEVRLAVRLMQAIVV